MERYNITAEILRTTQGEVLSARASVTPSPEGEYVKHADARALEERCKVLEEAMKYAAASINSASLHGIGNDARCLVAGAARALELALNPSRKESEK